MLYVNLEYNPASSSWKEHFLRFLLYICLYKTMPPLGLGLTLTNFNLVVPRMLLANLKCNPASGSWGKTISKLFAVYAYIKLCSPWGRANYDFILFCPYWATKRASLLICTKLNPIPSRYSLSLVLKSILQFWRRSHLKEMFTDRQTTDNRWAMITIAHFWHGIKSGWLQPGEITSRGKLYR